MLTGIRKIQRFSLRCPILLFPLSESTSAPQLLSLTKNISAEGAYVFDCPQWGDSSQIERSLMFASLFYEISLFANKEAEFRFLIRFRARAIRKDDDGFALKFSSKNKILPLSKRSDMTCHEIEASEMIEYMFPPGDW